MKILVTGDYEFSGDKLDIGKYYYAEPADTGTQAQNKTFHLLLQIFMVSNYHSYNVDTLQEFKDLIKRDYGAGYERFVFIQDTGNGLVKGSVKSFNDIPQNIAVDKYGNKMLWGILKSWSNYTLKERQQTISNVINVMLQLGIKDKRFYEIVEEFENRKN